MYGQFKRDVGREKNENKNLKKRSLRNFFVGSFF